MRVHFFFHFFFPHSHSLSESITLHAHKRVFYSSEVLRPRFCNVSLYTYTFYTSVSIFRLANQYPPSRCNAFHINLPKRVIKRYHWKRTAGGFSFCFFVHAFCVRSRFVWGTQWGNLRKYCFVDEWRGAGEKGLLLVETKGRSLDEIFFLSFLAAFFSPRFSKKKEENSVMVRGWVASSNARKFCGEPKSALLIDSRHGMGGVTFFSKGVLEFLLCWERWSIEGASNRGKEFFKSCQVELRWDEFQVGSRTN